MPATFRATPALVDDIKSAIERTLTHREIAIALAAQAHNAERINVGSRKEEDELLRREIGSMKKWATGFSTSLLVKTLTAEVVKHGLCESGTNVIYLDDQGTHTLDLDNYYLMKMADAIKEADWSLCGNNISVIAKHFDNNLGARLTKLIPAEMDYNEIRYPLSGGEAVIRLDVLTDNGVEAQLVGGDYYENTAWKGGVGKRLTDLLKESFVKLSADKKVELSLVVDASNSNNLDEFASSFSFP
jgi:hypothetical protein